MILTYNINSTQKPFPESLNVYTHPHRENFISCLAISGLVTHHQKIPDTTSSKNPAPASPPANPFLKLVSLLQVASAVLLFEPAVGVVMLQKVLVSLRITSPLLTGKVLLPAVQQARAALS